jgi:Putative zinc-finger
MKCEETKDLLFDLLYGELPSEQEKDVIEHLAECSECGKEYHELKATRAAIDKLHEPELPLYLNNRIMAHAGEAAMQKKSMLDFLFRRPVATAAISFIAVSVVIIIGVRGMKENPKKDLSIAYSTEFKSAKPASPSQDRKVLRAKTNDYLSEFRGEGPTDAQPADTVVYPANDSAPAKTIETDDESIFAGFDIAMNMSGSTDPNQPSEQDGKSVDGLLGGANVSGNEAKTDEVSFEMAMVIPEGEKSKKGTDAAKEPEKPVTVAALSVTPEVKFGPKSAPEGAAVSGDKADSKDPFKKEWGWNVAKDSEEAAVKGQNPAEKKSRDQNNFEDLNTKTLSKLKSASKKAAVPANADTYDASAPKPAPALADTSVSTAPSSSAKREKAPVLETGKPGRISQWKNSPEKLVKKAQKKESKGDYVDALSLYEQALELMGYKSPGDMKTSCSKDLMQAVQGALKCYHRLGKTTQASELRAWYAKVCSGN